MHPDGRIGSYRMGVNTCNEGGREEGRRTLLILEKNQGRRREWEVGREKNEKGELRPPFSRVERRSGVSGLGK